MSPHGDPDGRGLSRRDYLRLTALAGAAGSAGCEAPGVDQPGALPLTELASYWVGPESERPADVAPGTQYVAVDTDRRFLRGEEGWRWRGLRAPYVDADRIAGVADHVVRTTEELEAAFESLEAGDTVYVASGTYRPTSWLTIDVDDVSVVGQSRRGTLIRPADGANVGGFHVGRNSRVRDVTIENLAFDGNEGTMDDEVQRLHAFLVDDAENVTVRNCFATRTHPYHVHDRGGSGFTVRKDARDVRIVGNHTNDIGDRSVQVAGRDITVRGNHLTNGFDRAISLEVRHPDDRKYYSRNVAVVGNVGRNNSTGSVVGASQGSPQREGAGNYAIVGNVAAERHRRVVFVGIEEQVRNVAIVGNTGWQEGFRETRPGIHVSGGVSKFVVAGNSLSGYTGEGIRLDSGGTGFACVGNVVRGVRGDGIYAGTTGGVVSGNAVSSVAGVGVDVAGGDVTVSNNAVTGTGGHGILLAAGAAPSVLNANFVGAGGEEGESGDDGIHVAAGDSVVVANRVAAGGVGSSGYAVHETAEAADNVYVANSLPQAERAWRLDGSGGRLVGNRPAVSRESAREVRATDGTASLSFDRPHAEKPLLDVAADDAVLWSVEWARDGSGAYTGATLSFTAPDGAAANPEAVVRVRRR